MASPPAQSGVDPLSLRLDGKVAIVTGASRGIGEAIARAFASAGANVVLAARKIEGLAQVAESINAARAGSALAVAAHTGKEPDCAMLVERAVSQFKKVDIVVNNAATNPYFGPMLDTEMGAWDKTFEVNLKGYFWMARNVARHLREREAHKTGGGSIINVASVAGLMATPMQGCYGMTKAAVISMTKTFAVELAPSRIRVNAIAPGFVETRLASAITQNESLRSMVTGRTPMNRVASPNEIAGGALYLAGDSATFLTGHTLVIDGGMTIS